MSLLAKNINAEAAFLIERVTAIARAGGQIIVNQTAISSQERERDLFRLIRCEGFDGRIDIDRFQFAEILDLKGGANRKIEVGDAVIGFQHRR